MALAASCSNGADTPVGTGGAGVTGPGGSGGASAGGTAGIASGGTMVGGAAGSVGAAGGTAGASGGGAGGSGVGGAGAGGVAGQAGMGGSAGTGGSGDDWWFDGPRVPPALGSWPPPNIMLTEVTAATQPTAIAAPRADPSRLYFAEKWGVIRLIKDGVLLPEPALDMRDAVLEGGPSSDGVEDPNQGKRGLVGMAFHPDYETNGRMFVLYTADQGVPGYGTQDNSNVYDDGDMTIAEYHRSATNPDQFDPQPAQIVVQWDKGNCQQCSQHNGGSLEIGVDGFLWASTGDPPPYDDPGSQDLMDLNGKLLRFDISGDMVVGAGNYPGADPFIWSIGLRNTYKFSIDRYTGDVFVADVGEDTYEELTVESYGMGQQNHGWPIREGMHSVSGMCADCIEPIFEYTHTGREGTPGADNCIIGGYVYRGEAIPGLQGAYVHGDFGSGKIRALQVQEGQLLNVVGNDLATAAHTFDLQVKVGDMVSSLPQIFMGCFGEDAAGELFVCDYEGNRILRVDAQP